MLKELQRFLAFLRPAFSRQATYGWFVVVFIGFLLRDDTLGVSSIVRALALAPACYTCLLHFFHSAAWSVDGIMGLWWRWLIARDVAYRLGDRLVLLGDHTKTPKNGRKMPAVATLHQDSETAGKPSFFRGHHWGCLALLVRACDKFFATPLCASIQEGVAKRADCDEARLPKTVRVVRMAQRVARGMGHPAYLVLDAYFGVGSVFQAAGQALCGPENLVHILTRAKKNVVAYRPASRRPKKNSDPERESSNMQRTGNTLAAIEKFVNLQLLVPGILQLIATAYPERVKAKARCWLRTVSSKTPSEFVTRIALKNIVRGNLCGLGKDWITQLIRSRQRSANNQSPRRKVT